MNRFTFVALSLVWFGVGHTALAQAEATDTSAWAYYQEIELSRSDATYFDVLLPVSVFDGARTDLGDLRLYDADGSEVPYALRILEKKSLTEPVKSKRFNEGKGPEGSSEVTLELGEDRKGHNRVEVTSAGENFRRRITVEGSESGDEWVELADDRLLKFDALKEEAKGVTYAASNFRQLCVRVYQDPEVDEVPVAIDDIDVSRHVDVPGEYVVRTAALHSREAVQASGGPGSAWRIDLEGKNVPVERLYVHVQENDFARDYEVQEITDNRFYPFVPMGFGELKRRAEEQVEPLEVSLETETQASRLRLVVSEHENAPLTIDRIDYSAAARQVVIENTGKLASPLRLYYGNPAANPPQYDFERNLPPRLAEKPERLTFADRQDNPAYVPPPQAWTERWPWLMHTVLTVACLLLAAIIVSVARATIQIAERTPANDAPAAPA